MAGSQNFAVPVNEGKLCRGRLHRAVVDSSAELEKLRIGSLFPSLELLRQRVAIDFTDLIGARKVVLQRNDGAVRFDYNRRFSQCPSASVCRFRRLDFLPVLRRGRRRTSSRFHRSVRQISHHYRLSRFCLRSSAFSQGRAMIAGGKLAVVDGSRYISIRPTPVVSFFPRSIMV